MKEQILTTEELWNLIPKIIGIASKAGDAIMEVYQNNITVTYKEDSSPVTAADFRSTEIISAGLKEITPLIPIICEETSELPYTFRKQCKQIWIVDPLDGTKEFIAKNDQFAINIAFIHEQIPILGIIFAPVTRICYYAVKGMGTFKLEPGKQPQRLSVKTQANSGQEFTVAISRSHLSMEDANYIEALKLRYPSVNTLPYGSSLKFGLLAEGKADVYPKFGYTMEWDTASGQIILEEAGAKINSTDTGLPLLYNKENTRNPYFIAKLR